MRQFLIDFDIFFLQKMERRAWTEQQDLYLREILQKNTLTKWNQVAKLLELDYGVKGRSPKECRLRYTSQLETSQPKKEWSFCLEQKMMNLHNELGNRWAVIGHQMGGISDNAIKNHFYSLLRRALRKLNIVISREFPKEVKEFKPTVLYRIVEVADQRAKELPQNQLEFAINSHELKNDLLDFAYDQNIQETEEPEIDFDLAKDLIQRVSDFMKTYKKRGRKSRKGSGQGQNLLNCRKFQRRINVEGEDDSSSNIQQDQIEGESNSDKTKSRKTSHLSINTDKMIEETQPLGMRTRARSQGNVTNKFVEKLNFSMGEEIPEVQQVEGTGVDKANQTENIEGNISDHLQIQGILSGYQLLEEAPPPPKMTLIKRESSYSRLSLSGERHEMDFRFFDESSFQLFGLPQLDVVKRESQMDENIFG